MERPVESIFDRKSDNEETGSRLKEFVKLLTPRELSVFLLLSSQDSEFNMEDVARHLEVKTPAVWRAVKDMRAKASSVFGSEEIETRQIKRGRK
jgi:DNA-binding MarR family transcriptional regulator